MEDLVLEDESVMIELIIGLLFIEARHILLVKHGDDMWKLPGGLVENLKMSFLVAARKKVREELNLDFNLRHPWPFTWYHFIESPKGRIDIQSVHYFVNRADPGVKIIPSEKITALDWISLDGLRKIHPAKNIIPAANRFGYYIP
jgi:ADP-ribose pyrophosphatase YjhB (NUDIX family)